MSTEVRICELCGIPIEGYWNLVDHRTNGHWNWSVGMQEIRYLRTLSIRQLEQRQKNLYDKKKRK